MNKKERTVTFGALNIMMHHQNQFERKCQDIQHLLTGRNQPLLPEDWTDEDAWKLARALADLMGLLARVTHTVFDEEHPYPSQDTPLEDISYYNPFNLGAEREDPTIPPDPPLDLWAEVLHCGILAAAGNPEFCFPSDGTFSDLEKLFLGTVRSGSGTMPQFDTVLEQLGSALSDANYRELAEWGFGPEPPSFPKTMDTIEEAKQERIYTKWQEWTWLSRFPFRNALLQAIERILSDDFHNQALHFINWELGLNNRLRLAIDLYLYQTGASGMLEDSYYAAYAMLCRTQRQIKAAMATEEG